MTWALVTGGAKRLGAVICKSLAANGNNVIVHYRTSHHEAQQVVDECRSIGVQSECIYGDFTTEEATSQFINALLRRFEGINVLINNVGNYPESSAIETSSAEWNTLFQTNLHAPFALIHALIPGLKQTQGSIINIGVSGLNGLRAATKATAYRTTKLSLLFLTKSLARELAPFQVCVNMVSPGQLSISVDLPKEKSNIPMGHPGTVEDVARVISFLLDPKNHYITGQNIEVSGGLGL